MPYMAQWGSKGFLISPTKIAVLENFSTSVELKADSENDTSGTSPTNTRGVLARPVSFSVTYTRAAGVDPRAQLEEWEGLVGQSNPLYIGDKRFGPSSLILNKVDSSEFVFSPKGDFLSVTVSLSFVENSGNKKSSTSNTSASTGGSTGGSSGSVYAETVANLKAEKSSAMNATASSIDRSIKNQLNERKMTY